MKAPRFKGWFAKLPSLNQLARDREGRTVDAVIGRGALTAAQLDRD